ncbi:DinB family protein [Robertkochia sediminum]|uniref:DinB family protein n=1 Tax=Robertkochia sediminum TaxID=2785326 RepID=UPI001F1AAF9E|nr:DinB family protein [Robertkochia sediminum]MBL7471834.1 DinB family protein [Robertkochia sediminum]
MKRTLVLILILAFNYNGMLAQQNEPKGAFLEKWENSKNYLLAMVDSIPADSLDYKPTPRQMSVREQLAHIRMNMLWLGHTYFGDDSTNTHPALAENAGKEDLSKALEQAFTVVHDLVNQTDMTSLSEEVKFFAGPKSRLQILNLLHDHVTHHRGQLVVYLNLMDLTPPRYSGW